MDAGMNASISVSLLYKRDFKYKKLVLTNKLISISNSGNFSCIVKNNFLLWPKSMESILKYINRVYINCKINGAPSHMAAVWPVRILATQRIIKQVRHYPQITWNNQK